MDDWISLSKWRFEKAEQCLRSAQVLLENEDYCGAANRSYYTVFHCIRSILALKGIDFKKHSAIISYFREHYIRKGIFATELSDILGNLFSIRNDSDYDDYYIIGKQEVVDQLENAAYFLSCVDEYLKRIKQ